MKTPRRRSSEKTRPAARSKAEEVKEVLALTAPMITVLTSTALVGPGIAQAGEPIMKPAGLDPVGLIAAGTGIATLGAYQLIKMRARKGPDRKD